MNLSSAIKSMDRRIIAEFAVLLPLYQKWYDVTGTSSRDKRSIESAIKVLQAV